MNNESFNYLENRPTSSYSISVNNEIDNLKLLKHNSTITPFGSYLFRYQKYPGDVDLIEDVKGNSKQEIIRNFVKRIKEIVRNIIKKPNHYFSEIKIGQDNTYAIKVGYLCNGTYYVNPEFKQKLTYLYQNKQFDKKDYETCMRLLRSPTLHFDVFDEIIKIMREYYIIRWSADEILKDKKKLRSGHMTNIESSLINSFLTKIDEIVFINGNFVEVSNIYQLQYKNNNELKNLNEIFRGNVIPLEIERLYYSNMWYNPNKMLKRVFSYSNYMIKSRQNETEYYNIINKVAPFLVSNISLLYQQKSYIDNIIKLVNHYSNIPQKLITYSLDNVKNKIATVQQIPLKELLVINEVLIHSMKKVNIEGLTLISEGFEDIINEYTVKFLKSIDWEILPDSVLPNNETIMLKNPLSPLIDKQCKRSYIDTVVRTPTERPVEQFNRHIDILEKIPVMPIIKPEKKEEDNKAKELVKDIILSQKEPEYTPIIPPEPTHVIESFHGPELHYQPIPPQKIEHIPAPKMEPPQEPKNKYDFSYFQNLYKDWEMPKYERPTSNYPEYNRPSYDYPEYVPPSPKPTKPSLFPSNPYPEGPYHHIPIEDPYLTEYSTSSSNMGDDERYKGLLSPYLSEYSTTSSNRGTFDIEKEFGEPGEGYIPSLEELRHKLNYPTYESPRYIEPEYGIPEHETIVHGPEAQKNPYLEYISKNPFITPKEYAKLGQGRRKYKKKVTKRKYNRRY